LCASTLAHTELANLVQVLKVTTISFMAYLTVMRNWLSSSHQSCWWDGFARSFIFLLELLKCSWLCAIHFILQVTPQGTIK